MELNAPVPNFTLQDDQDQSRSLEEFRGKPVVLFFYPKADTPGCTIEACGFRDTFTKLGEAGVVVLGISRGHGESPGQVQGEVRAAVHPAGRRRCRGFATCLAC